MTPRPARPDLRDQKERQILLAAAAVFAKHGFRAARIADIAEAAGIGKGTIYEYFASKEELFLRLFDWYTDQAFSSMIEASAGTSSAVDDLKRSCDTLLLSCREMQELYPLTMEFWSASTAPEFRDAITKEFRRLYTDFRGAIASLIRAGMEQGELGSHVDPDAFAAVLVGALDGIILQAWFDPEFDPVAAGRHFLDVMVVGIGSMPRTMPPTPNAPSGGKES